MADDPFGGGPFSAAIDPLITIDPSSVAAGYSLELSPNVTQSVVAPSVPEPSTWTMLLAGFAVLGIRLSRPAAAPAAHRRGSLPMPKSPSRIACAAAVVALSPHSRPLGRSCFR